MDTLPRLFTLPAQSCFLLGPRGTGKSTLLKLLFKEALWIDLLRPDTFRWYFAKPERLYDTLAGQASNAKIVIDEIQKVPALLSVVHSAIVDSPYQQFILTGSSARKLKRTGIDLLAGRALNCTLYPFMAAELGDKFSLRQALNQGMLPVVLNSLDPEFTLQSYIQLYLHEEIQAEGLVRNLDDFSRFLEVITLSHANLLNVNNIARECEVKRKTVENYLQILDDLLLAFKLPVFTKRAKRDLVAHPKFYLFDTGVYHAMRPQGYLDRPDEIYGAALEGLVAQHLQAWNDYSREKNSISYWRTRAGLEVDFIVYGQQGLWAIEVKHNTRVDRQDLKGLHAFQQDYPEAKCLLLYQGREILSIENVLCIPCELFLRQLLPNQLLWKK